MIDRERVINGLEHCRRCTIGCQQECPYKSDFGCRSQLAADTLELLKDQTTTWVEEKDRYYHWHCEKCGFVEGAPAMTHKYCPNCGRKVMRDE